MVGRKITKILFFSTFAVNCFGMKFSPALEKEFTDTLSEAVTKFSQTNPQESNGAFLTVALTCHKAKAHGIDKLPAVLRCTEIHNIIMQNSGYALVLQAAQKKTEFYKELRKNGEVWEPELLLAKETRDHAWAEFRRAALQLAIKYIAKEAPTLNFGDDPENIGQFFINNKKVDPTSKEALYIEAILLLRFKLRKIEIDATTDEEPKKGAEQGKKKTKDRSCTFCKKPDCTMLCGGCKRVYYCSVKCSKKNWKNHKIICLQVSKKSVKSSHVAQRDPNIS